MPQKDLTSRESFSNVLGSFGSVWLTEDEDEPDLVDDELDEWFLATVTPTAIPTAARITIPRTVPMTSPSASRSVPSVVRSATSPRDPNNDRKTTGGSEGGRVK